jgi:hypothetical protein
MKLRKSVMDVVDWIVVVQDRSQWKAVVSTVMNIIVS